MIIVKLNNVSKEDFFTVINAAYFNFDMLTAQIKSIGNPAIRDTALLALDEQKLALTRVHTSIRLEKIDEHQDG